MTSTIDAPKVTDFLRKSYSLEEVHLSYTVVSVWLELYDCS